MTVLLFCFIVLLALFSGSAIFAGFGSAICTFMYGTFGYGCFLVVAALVYLGVWLAFEKRIKVKWRPALFMALTVYAVFLLFHSVSTGYGEWVNDGLYPAADYISGCYLIAAEGFPSYTFGGVLSAILVYPVASLTTFIGAYIIFSLLTVAGIYFTINSFLKNYGKKPISYYFKRRAGRPVSAEVQAYSQAAASDNSAVAREGVVSVPAAEEQTAYAMPQNSGADLSSAYGAPAAGQYAPVQPQYDHQYGGAQYAAPAQPVQPQYQGGYGYGQPYAQPAAPSYESSANYASNDDEDKFSPKKLGRKILFDNDEFAAESYRRNGIFDENSYFNHPIRNDGDYIRGFSDGKSKSKGTTIEPTTYTSAYQQSVQQQTNAGQGVVYGDAPAQKLEDDSVTSYTAPTASAAPENTSPLSDDNYYSGSSNSYAPRADEGASYGAGDSFGSDNTDDNFDDIDFGAPETEQDDRPELSENFGEEEPSPEQPAVDTPAEQFPAPRADSRRLDDALFGSSDRLADRVDRRENVRGDDFLRRDDSAGALRRDDAAGTDRRDLSRGTDFTSSRGTDFTVSRGNEAQSASDSNLSRGDFSRRTDDMFTDSTDSTENSAPAGGAEPPRRIAGFSESPSDISRSRGDGASDGNEGAGGISSLFSSSNSRLEGRGVEPDVSRLSSRRSNANLFDDDSAEIEDSQLGAVRREPDRSAPLSSQPQPPVQPVRREANAVQETDAAEEKPKEEQKPPHVWKKYVRPSFDLLDDYPESTATDTAEVEESKRIIVETLESFRIECYISDVVVGPAITRFDVIICDRTNIKASLRYRESIAMALKKENVNAYLNYSKGALSIEVPNSKRSVVGLKGMMQSTAYMNAKTNSLTFALGKNVEGACICPDITKMPHLLVAGTTGSGKSICLSSLLISLLYKYGPEELRFILVDPKQVEFISYDKLPHLMINEIIYDVDKAIKALNWAIKEMERRYTLFKEMTETGENAKGHVKVATKDINEYNSHLEEGLEKLPKIVIVLDEFGDLMLQAKKDIESRIIKLVQKARAAGIHLILATQRPSVDCITGLIKSNLPTRIGFKVGSFDDSRTIFDVGGAEKLLGRGDMYFRSAERPELMRIQGCFVDTPEVQRVTDFIKQHNETYFDQSVSDFINKVEEPEQTSSLAEGAESSEETKVDDTFIRALKYCVMSNAASVSMIQRRFPIGYIKACKIVDWMENMNYITKAEGSKSRKVLLSQEEFFNTYGDVDD